MPKVEIRIPSVLEFLHPLPGHVHESDKPSLRPATGTPLPASPRRRTASRVTEFVGFTPALEIQRGNSDAFLQMTALLNGGWRRYRPQSSLEAEFVFAHLWLWRRPSEHGADATLFRNTQEAHRQFERLPNAILTVPPRSRADMVVILAADGWHEYQSEWQTPDGRPISPVHYFNTQEAYQAYLGGVAVPSEGPQQVTPRPGLVTTRDAIFQVGALRAYGWTQVPPLGHSEVGVMSYRWRRPGIGNRQRGRLYRSTQHAYNQLRRDNAPQRIPWPSPNERGDERPAPF